MTTSLSRVYEGAIGIDLGTTHSCVAISQEGRVEVLANDQGNRTMPSCVAYTETEELVGEPASAQIIRNPRNTVFQPKRLLGKKFDCETVQSSLRKISCPVGAEEGTNNAMLEVTCQGNEVQKSPVEICATILCKLKETAEAFVGATVNKAVIAIPTNYTPDQMQATRDAAKGAGLTILRLINEPVAASVAYGLDMAKASTILVFDLGGAGLECSVLRANQGSIQCLADTLDAHLGGEDFDRRLVKHFSLEFNKKYKGMDITENKKSMVRLRTACERVKKVLSTANQSALEADSLHEGMDLFSNITRARFEDLMAPLFKKCMDLVGQTLSDAGVDKSEVNEVVMVGGGSTMPKLQQQMASYFEGTGAQLRKDIMPDEAVAYGAAVQAQILTTTKADKEHFEPIMRTDATALAIGFEGADGVMIPVIAQHTVVPVRKAFVCSTNTDNQAAVYFRLFEGEKSIAKENHEIGDLVLEGIAPSAAGTPQIKVTFDVDAQGVLKVHAVDPASKVEIRVAFQGETRLSLEEAKAFGKA